MISKCWTENPVNQRERKIKSNRKLKPKRDIELFFFIFCFSSSKNNAQLVPQYLKKLKTLQNISFVYIYLYIYLYLYNLLFFFFVFQTAAVRVGGCWRPGEIPPGGAAVWDTNTGRAVLTGNGSSRQLKTHHAYDPGFSKRTHKYSFAAKSSAL